jgi:hypothetical protein
MLEVRGLPAAAGDCHEGCGQREACLSEAAGAFVNRAAVRPVRARGEVGAMRWSRMPLQCC